MILKLLLNTQMDDIYRNIEEYNPNKKRKILIVVHDTVAGMVSNKKLNPIVTELLIKGRKLNISLVFITQSYLAFPKNIRLNSSPYFIELQQIAYNHLSNIEIKDLKNV